MSTENEMKPEEVHEIEGAAETPPETRQPSPEELLAAKEREVVFDMQGKIKLVESSLSRDNSTLSLLPRLSRELDESLPRGAQMKRTVDDLFQGRIRPLLKKMFSVGEEVDRFKSTVASAEEVTPEMATAVSRIQKELDLLVWEARKVVEDSTNTMRRIQRWADDGVRDRVISSRSGEDTIAIAGRIKVGLEKLQEENIDSPRLRWTRLAEDVDEIMRRKTSERTQPREAE